ncbi:hypothetical protein FQN49_008644, partial [Arthroderma sp. PD_2]
IGGKKHKVALSHKEHGKGTILAESSGNSTDHVEEEGQDIEQDNSRSKQPEPDLSHGHVEQSTAAATTPPQTSKPSKRSGKLGTIGGAKAPHKSTKTNLQEDNTSSSPIVQQPSKDDDHAGVDKLSGEWQNSAELPPPLPASSRRTNELREEHKSDKEESPEERADRKRQELRRQLETGGKCQTKPAKKKRKF